MQLLLLLTCALLATTRSQPAQVFSSDGNLTLAPAHNRSVVVHGELVVKGSRAMTSADVDAALATLEAQIGALEAQTAACSCAAPSATTSAVFNTTWDTTKVTAGSSALDQIRLPLEATGSYNFTVVWGDGTQDRVTAHDDAAVTHTYSQEGVYAVVIEGSIEGWRFNNGGDKAKLLSVTQWGPLRLGNNGGYFYGTSNMEIVATDLLDLTNTMDLSRAFTDSGIGGEGNLNDWDVSKVTSMTWMFSDASSFDQPLNKWNVSQVSSMSQMFLFASKFNQPLNDWDTSSVTEMVSMFSAASLFNQPLDYWNTSKVLSMNSMFRLASAFNQSLNNWDTSSVTGMIRMFNGASLFDQPLDNWDVSKVSGMDNMFEGATVFNQDLSPWCVAGFGAAPVDFDTDALGWSRPRPVWGTCP